MYFSTEQTVSTQPPCLSTEQHRYSKLNFDHICGTTAVAMTWTNVIHFWYHEEVLSLQPMFPPKPSDTLPLEVDAQRRCVQSKPSDTLPLEADAQRRCVQNTTHTCHVSIFVQVWCKKLHQLIKRLLGHSIITKEGFATLQIIHVLFPI